MLLDLLRVPNQPYLYSVAFKKSPSGNSGICDKVDVSFTPCITYGNVMGREISAREAITRGCGNRLTLGDDDTYDTVGNVRSGVTLNTADTTPALRATGNLETTSRC